MARDLRFFLILVCLGPALACTNAKPQFSNMESSFPAVFYFGKTNHTIMIVDPGLDTTVSGTCDKRTQSLQFKIEGYHDWDSASFFASGPIVESCQSTGTFSFDLKSLNSMGTWNTSQSVRFSLLAKASYSMGESSISRLNIDYSVPIATVPGQFHLGQGGGVSSSSGYRARAHIREISGEKATSSSFQIGR